MLMITFSNNKQDHTAAIVGSVVGFIALIAIIVAIYLYRRDSGLPRLREETQGDKRDKGIFHVSPYDFNAHASGVGTCPLSRFRTCPDIVGS